ncbi:hypothetical protein HN448_04435 [archaeon]|jgi:hypothetical protein|nr:hypothetical protein [archaeon]
MVRRYIEEKEFGDFKENFNLLVQTLNHNVTDIRDDVKKFQEGSVEIFGEVKELKGQLKTSNRLLWTIIGIITTVMIAAVISGL